MLYEDEYLIAVNKHVPAATQVNANGSLASAIRNNAGDPAGRLFDVHRIDTPVTGIVLYARTKKSARLMSEAFSGDGVNKRYWAAAEKCPSPEAGTLENYLLHDRENNRSICVPKERPGARYCETGYSTIGASESYCFLELTPRTGRTHQIRAQLHAAGCPIKGDRKYGAKRGNRNRLIHLHAGELEFNHPVTGDTLLITAEPPEDPLWRFFVEQYGTIALHNRRS